MAKLLFNLRNVPEDEADEVRALLTEHGVDWYETRPGPWGVSHGGLWLRDAEAWPEARRLLDGYQQARREQAREQAGLHQGETFIELLRARPGYVLPRLFAIVAIVALVLALPWLLLR
ncbi:DUF6164 family protein [Pseudoxanthomonas koreensis]|uniref:DUF6164 family protein n=1 Tax=Pseudoxanthomonas koreensis TaxID=266061 RepID=UPI001390AE53|nr:DUF6164 family protein [Pseudoxanthomonas koreensis]KAF1693423.1 hypothetical protein CSC64_05765 [Pseudoxanthomonas koreensis]